MTLAPADVYAPPTPAPSSGEVAVAVSPLWHRHGLAELGDELAAAVYDRDERAAIVDADRVETSASSGATLVRPQRDESTTTDCGAAPIGLPRLDALDAPTGRSVADVLASWRAEGPLVHEPTGFAALDAMTGGGPVYGSRWYLLGAPDAGKTALGVQLGHDYARRGIHVGFYAVDEEDGDLVTRLAQRVGWGRRDCEQRDEDAIALIGEELGSLPLRFYGGDEHTIETAAADLYAWTAAATPSGQPVRCAFIVDSVQTITCDAVKLATMAGKEQSPRMVVAENVRALRAAATRYRLIAIATGEMNRAAYRSVQATEESNDIAAGAESRAIEYSARVLLTLRSVAGEADVIELGIAKNKHGPATRSPIYLSIDRARMTLSERDAPAMPDPEGAKGEQVVRRVLADAARVAVVIARDQGIGSVRLRSALPGMGQRRGDAAVYHLESVGAVRMAQGPRTAQLHYLIGPSVPPDVLDLLTLDERTDVVRATPPAPAQSEGDAA